MDKNNVEDLIVVGGGIMGLILFYWKKEL